jgi:UDP-glucose 4-epimerase
VDNAVSANLLACQASSAVATGRVFNIGTGLSHTLNEVYAAIAGELGFSAPPIYGPPREGDIKHSLADISRATKELGYQPKAHFHEGLRKTVAWYVAEKEKSALASLQS